MAEKPCRFHRAIKGALKLARADALLAARNEADRLQPEMQREMRVLENRAVPHREGLAALVALTEAGATGRESADLLLGSAAMRANRAFRPKVRFDVGEGGFFVVENGV